MKLLRPIGLLALASAAVWPVARAIDISTVPVGNPGNAPDFLTGLGNVDYLYEISKYEITNTQFCEFANACMDDPNYLSTKQAYFVVSGSNAGWGIELAPNDGDSKKMRLRPKVGCESLPVRFALGTPADGYIRDFVAWINAGTSPVEEIDAGTVSVKTKRPKKDGGRLVKDAAGKVVYEEVEEARKVTHYRRKQPAADGTWFLADANELYKAAFHDAKAGKTGIYFNFSTAANRLPVVTGTGSPSDAHLAALPDNVSNSQSMKPEIFPVGASSPSPYGAFDLTGNAPEIYFREEPEKAPRGYALGKDVATTFGGGSERIAELQSRACCLISNQQFQSAKQSHIEACPMSGFRLVRIKGGQLETTTPTTPTTPTPAVFLATSPDGDGWLCGIPKINAGSWQDSGVPGRGGKGGGWEWVRETLANTMGKFYKSRTEAEANAYSQKFKRQDLGNTLYGLPLYSDAAQLETNTVGAKIKAVFDFSDRKSVSEILRKYNRIASKDAQVEADMKKLMLDMGAPLRSGGPKLDVQAFKKSRASETAAIAKFEQKVVESLKNKAPLMWCADLGLLPNNQGGVCAVITGINPKTHEITFATDPQGYPQNFIRRIPSADAYAATIGLYSVELK